MHCHLNSLELFVFVFNLLARLLSLQISARASDLNFLLACGVGTFSLVALCIAVVNAFFTLLRAFLSANILRLLAVALMAVPDAEMTATL